MKNISNLLHNNLLLHLAVSISPQQQVTQKKGCGNPWVWGGVKFLGGRDPRLGN